MLWSIGRLEWSIYAAFGAFTSLYGRNHVHLSRSRMQLSLAALLTGSTVLGVAVGPSEHRTWLGVLVAGFVAAVGSLLSGAIATGLGIGHPYWAMVGAVVPLAARDLLPQLVRGAQRVIGTFVGLGVSALLLWVDPRGLLLILVIVLLQGVAELLVGRNYALALVAITPLALLVGNLVVPVPAATLVFDRGVETVIGVVVGVLIAWVTRRRDSAAPA